MTQKGAVIFPTEFPATNTFSWNRDQGTLSELANEKPKKIPNKVNPLRPPPPRNGAVSHATMEVLRWSPEKRQLADDFAPKPVKQKLNPSNLSRTLPPRSDSAPLSMRPPSTSARPLVPLPARSFHPYAADFARAATALPIERSEPLAHVDTTQLKNEVATVTRLRSQIASTRDNWTLEYSSFQRLGDEEADERRQISQIQQIHCLNHEIGALVVQESLSRQKMYRTESQALIRALPAWLADYEHLHRRVINENEYTWRRQLLARFSVWVSEHDLLQQLTLALIFQASSSRQQLENTEQASWHTLLRIIHLFFEETSARSELSQVELRRRRELVAVHGRQTAVLWNRPALEEEEEARRAWLALNEERQRYQLVRQHLLIIEAQDALREIVALENQARNQIRNALASVWLASKAVATIIEEENQSRTRVHSEETSFWKLLVKHHILVLNERDSRVSLCNSEVGSWHELRLVRRRFQCEIREREQIVDDERARRGLLDYTQENVRRKLLGLHSFQTNELHLRAELLEDEAVECQKIEHKLTTALTYSHQRLVLFELEMDGRKLSEDAEMLAWLPLCRWHEISAQWANEYDAIVAGEAQNRESVQAALALQEALLAIHAQQRSVLGEQEEEARQEVLARELLERYPLVTQLQAARRVWQCITDESIQRHFLIDSEATSWQDLDLAAERVYAERATFVEAEEAGRNDLQGEERSCLCYLLKHVALNRDFVVAYHRTLTEERLLHTALMEAQTADLAYVRTLRRSLFNFKGIPPIVLNLSLEEWAKATIGLQQQELEHRLAWLVVEEDARRSLVEDCHRRKTLAIRISEREPSPVRGEGKPITNAWYMQKPPIGPIHAGLSIQYPQSWHNYYGPVASRYSS
eukprot:TRINITY_DN10681_c0_g1_i1.p1 TRINITY_DN10681_c0_g1~~TRINITY_DN10681_c0_g1_i1.p1  ORF type:complete len:889 (-),score=95.99 TRINITY_DN10681_c0_g1_i1:25-2652(-)